MTSGILPAPFSLMRLDSVGSTNDEARRLALDGAAADLLVVTAKCQTAGRGRRGRVWQSPPGNLHMSVLIRRSRDLAASAQIGFVAALALAEALAELLPGADFRCKWPNDVLATPGGSAGPAAPYRKVAGMLLETEGNDWLVLGLGVDVVEAPPPGEALFAAVSLADLGWNGDADGVLAAFCERFGPWLSAWRAEGFAAIHPGWLARARGLGEPAVVRLDKETLTGLFTGLDEDGALILDQGNDGTRRIMAGDVFFPG
ncbi:biotin--[acetyl-CoA-carboxylase] ligase [Paramagnetospirillum marisnigri]|uniref:biotin--[biotin carboxyl-carrier protein] ligase n=1 Tax=Paramagnetospirillum marisnigri TaxID=1285242 RepID=A0A178MWR8_9PROT|nr:biotin--[acetyl-CoA-carboxylase] ligase [Paramagnetospirillum marisnigri]OAN53925.1 biotin--[acetyl-CoA-carboxylase] ligase [Paramagnetospirillum marisnigri]